MINDPVGINANQVSTMDNVIANCISHFPNHSNPCIHHLSFIQDFLQLWHCRCSHPCAELVSCILDVLLLSELANSRYPNLRQHISPDINNLTFCHKHHIDNPCLQVEATLCRLLASLPPYVPHQGSYHHWHHHLVIHCQTVHQSVSKLFTNKGLPLSNTSKIYFNAIIISSLQNYESIPCH